MEQNVTEAKTEMAKQQTRAAIAERSLLEIQERLKARRITPEQHAAYVSTLLPYAGSPVALTRLGDAEAGPFADDIYSVLHDAKWAITLNRVGMVSSPGYGLWASVNDKSDAGKALIEVLSKLPDAHIKHKPHVRFIGDIFVGLNSQFYDSN